MITVSILTREATQKIVAELEAEVMRLRAQEQNQKRHAVKNKEHLADGYWEARHTAEQRLIAARRLMEALA